MIPLNKALNELIRSLGLEDEMTSRKIELAWEELVGEIVASKVKIKKFEKGKLLLTTESSTWRAELTMRREKLRSEINDKIGKNAVFEIIIR